MLMLIERYEKKKCTMYIYISLWVSENLKNYSIVHWVSKCNHLSRVTVINVISRAIAFTFYFWCGASPSRYIIIMLKRCVCVRARVCYVTFKDETRFQWCGTVSARVRVTPRKLGNKTNVVITLNSPRIIVVSCVRARATAAASNVIYIYTFI